jgi:hypothetical protein
MLSVVGGAEQVMEAITLLSGLLHVFHDLLYLRPVQTDLSCNLSIAHATFPHSVNTSAKLLFIRISQITLS